MKLCTVLCFSRVELIQRKTTVRKRPRVQTGVLSAVLKRAGNWSWSGLTNSIMSTRSVHTPIDVWWMCCVWTNGKSINLNWLILCPQLLKEAPWASEGQEPENKEDKDASEEAQLRIMAWAKELQTATEVGSPRLKNKSPINLWKCFSAHYCTQLS